MRVVIDTKVIISGDSDLLTVSGYENVQIMAPREFADRYISLSKDSLYRSSSRLSRRITAAMRPVFSCRDNAVTTLRQ